MRLKLVKHPLWCSVCKRKSIRLRSIEVSTSDPMKTATSLFCPDCNSLVPRLLAQSGIPTGLVREIDDLELNEYNRGLVSDMKSVARHAFPNLLRNGSWLLYGKTGSGKTLHACTFGKLLIRSFGISVKYIQVARYLNELKRLFHDYSEEGQAHLERRLALRDAPVLIVDDLNRSYRAGVEYENLYDIADYRSSRNLFTIFTTQYKDLTDILPEETASRIEAMSTPYHLGPVNRRQ
jgi:DNA replication protein DnaC